MPRPILLDLYCGAGGAAVGYHRAGFEVFGVDINPQPNYPYTFFQGDAIWFAKHFGHEFDAIHASPPCQRYSQMSRSRPGLSEEYPDLIADTRGALDSIGVPYVIENVPGSPLIDPIMLCGSMFGRKLYRHRLFETSFPFAAPEHPKHIIPASKAGHWRPGTVISVAGNCAPMKIARQEMDIDWTTRAELVEAIPPYFTEFIGKRLMEWL